MSDKSYLHACINSYAEGDARIHMVDLLYDEIMLTNLRATTICGACAELAAALNPSSEQDRAKEKRIRELISIVSSMQAVGLIA